MGDVARSAESRTIMISRSFARVSGWLVVATFCALVTSRDSFASPSPSALPSPRPEVTSKPGRPRGGLLATILPWPESRFPHEQRIKLKLIVSNVSDVPIRTNLVYQPLPEAVRVSVIAHAGPPRELTQVPNAVMAVLGPPPTIIPPGEIREYEIPLDKYTPEITTPGSYTVTVRLRVGSENGAAVWLVTNQLAIIVQLPDREPRQ